MPDVCNDRSEVVLVLGAGVSGLTCALCLRRHGFGVTVVADNFAPRVRVPTLMLNGRYDIFFPVDVSQRFMFNLLGVREPDKRWLVYETGHGLPRLQMISESVGWLDRYFGSAEIH